MNKKPLETLPQYHFDRNKFCELFREVFTNDQIIDIDVSCGMCKYSDGFALFRYDDEFYILHKDSGVLINWYKHLGRTNTCNNPNFTLDDFRVFLVKHKEDALYEKWIAPDETEPEIWHPCSYDEYEDGKLEHDGTWVDGRWYEWLDKYGNREFARMKKDAIDHFYPSPQIVKEDDVIAFRPMKPAVDGCDEGNGG